jgi:hypothetical protein
MDLMQSLLSLIALLSAEDSEPNSAGAEVIVELIERLVKRLVR